MHYRAGIIAAVALAACGARAQDGAESGTLHVRVSGFETSRGALAIALFDNAADYEGQTNPVRRAWLDVSGDEVEWLVDALAFGEYAVVAYQDLNGNRKLDFRLLGMPKEPVGVSNDARRPFGPPGFDAAKFTVGPEGVTYQHMRLR